MGYSKIYYYSKNIIKDTLIFMYDSSNKIFQGFIGYIINIKKN